MATYGPLTRWLRNLPISWLAQREVGQDDVTSYGSVMDDSVDRLRFGVQARMPTKAPADALPYIGTDRGIVQGGSIAGPAESDADFGARAKKGWDEAWPYAGTPFGVLLQLYWTFGYLNVAIVQQNGLIYTINPPPSDPPDPEVDMIISEANPLAAPATPIPPRPEYKVIPAGNPWVSFDGKTDLCNRFMVVFGGILPPHWTDIQDPPTLTSAPSISEINTMKAIVNQWRNAEAIFLGIAVLAGAGYTWGYPPGTKWGSGLKWGQTDVFFYGA